MSAALLLALSLLGAPPAPTRLPAEQAHLAALAEALGHAHALHRLCAGAADDLWRSRMGKMLEVERPDPGLKQRLTDAFNTGFASGSGAFASCSPQSRNALSDVERKAATESKALAGGAPASNP